MATPVTDTELREVLNAVNALSQRVEVGFAQVDKRMDVGFAQVDTKLAQMEAKMDVKFAEVDTKFAQVDTKLAKMDGKIDVINERTKLSFWDFVGRAVIISMLSFLVLLAIKYALTGTIKLM